MLYIFQMDKIDKKSKSSAKTFESSTQVLILQFTQIQKLFILYMIQIELKFFTTKNR